MIDPDTIENIAKSQSVVSIMPKGGMEGTEGERHLEFAVSMNKHIILWRPPGRESETLPDILNGYDDLTIVDGDTEAATRALEEYHEMTPGDDIRFTEKGYE